MVMDRNLLLAVHALRAGLIDGDQMGRLYAAWAGDKTRSMAERLIESGSVDEGGLRRIERLVDEYLGSRDDEVRGPCAASPGEAACGSTISDPGGRGDDFATSEGPGPGQGDTVTLEPAGRDRARDAAQAAPVGARTRYERSHLHAQGGVGQVWLVVDSDLGREVALKEPRPDRVASRSAWDRFCDEALIVGQLQHPSIVPIYELATDLATRRPFYTMRFIRGVTLAEATRAYHQKRAAGQAVPADLAPLLNAFVAACDAIGYAHSQGVIHRDIKGQNVVLGESGEVMMLDWGLAKRVGRHDIPAESAATDGDAAHDATLQGQVLGTPSYMAPEQAEGRNEAIDHRTDIYGLGTILYEILAGRPPHEGGTTDELLRRAREDDPAPPRTVVPEAPRPLEAICLKAMAHQPERRYASATELAEDVRRWLAGEPVTVDQDVGQPGAAPGRNRRGPPSPRKAPSRSHRRPSCLHGFRRKRLRLAHPARLRARR